MEYNEFNGYSGTDNQSGQSSTNNDIQDNKLLAAISYIGILFLIPLLVANNSQYARYHANQGLVLFIISVIGTTVLSFIPILGWLLLIPFGLFTLICVVIGIAHALQGVYKGLPIMGGISIIK